LTEPINQKGEKMRKLTVIVTLLCLPMFYGFASIISGTSQLVSINSEPRGAEVVVNGVVRGITPVDVKIKREKDTSFIIRKEGYKDEVVELTTKFNMAFWGNALIGGLIGSSIDSSTGATIEYAPGSYHITLRPGRMSKLEKENFNKELETRNFILANYHNLSSDIAQGKGEYLSNLYSAFESGKQNSIETLKELRGMLTLHASIPAFAEAVIDEFLS